MANINAILEGGAKFYRSTIKEILKGGGVMGNTNLEPMGYRLVTVN